MCKRLDSIEALGAAAEELTAACLALCSRSNDGVSGALKSIYNETVVEPMPPGFTDLLGKLNRPRKRNSR